MSEKRSSIQFSRFCQARPEVVYGLLCDIRAHMQWGGERQSRVFRLLSLEVPVGAATVGTEFRSSGTIPASRFHFEDRSRITEAVDNSIFGFVTHSSVHKGGAKKMEAVYVHCYELTPEADGCRVAYTFRQERISNPLLRLSLPLVKTMTWKVGIPFMMRQGFDNLLDMAESQAATGEK
jgi:hypothetical protein